MHICQQFRSIDLSIFVRCCSASDPHSFSCPECHLKSTWLALQRGATEAAEAARIFEGQLAGALVAEDGQLALSNLAASAAHGFMPKIQTQGQLGQARWRLVSAPSIPGS